MTPAFLPSPDTPRTIVTDEGLVLHLDDDASDWHLDWGTTVPYVYVKEAIVIMHALGYDPIPAEDDAHVILPTGTIRIYFYPHDEGASPE